MGLLYLDACVRSESRTRRLSETLIRTLLQKTPCEVETRFLAEEDFHPLDEAALERRTACCAAGDFSDAMFDAAKQFAAADTIVIAAPYWDLSFPAILKVYLEQLLVTGITFRYSEQGIPQGLCRAKKLYYVTTAGGKISEPDFGYAYIRALAENLLGICETICYKAEFLDVDGMDAEQLLVQAENHIWQQESQ